MDSAGSSSNHEKTWRRFYAICRYAPPRLFSRFHICVLLTSELFLQFYRAEFQDGEESYYLQHFIYNGLKENLDGDVGQSFRSFG